MSRTRDLAFLILRVLFFSITDRVVGWVGCESKGPGGGGISENAGDRRAALFMGVDVERGADLVGAVLHDAQAEATAALVFGRQSDAVVANQERDPLTGPGQTDGHGFGLAVFHRIVDALLYDAEQVRGKGGILDDQIVVAFQPARDGEELFDVADQFAQRGGEALRLQFRREQAARQVARLRQSLDDQAADLAGVVRLGQRLGGEFSLQNLAQKTDARQVLAKTVMQVLADALLFAVADLENFPFQELSIRHVADEGEDFILAAFDDAHFKIARVAENRMVTSKALGGARAKRLLHGVHGMMSDLGRQQSQKVSAHNRFRLGRQMIFDGRSEFENHPIAAHAEKQIGDDAQQGIEFRFRVRRARLDAFARWVRRGASKRHRNGARLPAETGFQPVY